MLDQQLEHAIEQLFHGAKLGILSTTKGNMRGVVLLKMCDHKWSTHWKPLSEILGKVESGTLPPDALTTASRTVEACCAYRPETEILVAISYEGSLGIASTLQVIERSECFPSFGAG